MTTAHPFLAELDSGNGPLVFDDLDAPISDSDSDYQSDAEIAEAPNHPRTSLPFDQMRYSRLWVSEQWTRVAYSFLGRMTLSNARNEIQLQWPSSSDWALFQVTEGSLLSKLQLSPRISSFIPEDRLTSGEVQIMDRVDALSAGILTQTTTSIHTAKAVMHVREILLDEVLSSGASGAWVIRGNDVCGYIVAATGSGRSCFMVPMDCAFKEIEAAFGVKPKLGPELIKLPEEDEVWGSLYNAGREPTSDDHRPADSTRSTSETQRSDNQRPVPATDTRKLPWIPSLTRKGVSIFRKERHPYEPLSIFNMGLNLRSAPRIQPYDRDPYPIEMTDMENPPVTADETSRIGQDDERSISIIPRSWQEDPRDNGKRATDWSSRKKAWNFYVIFLITFLNTLASTVVAPGVPSIMDEFGINNVLGTFVISIFVLGQVTGPLLLAPISDAYGRLLVYHLSNLSLVIWNIACALAPNTSALLIFRLFAGCAAAGPLAIGRSSVEDMFLYDRMDQGPRFLVFTANSTLQRPLILLSIASMLGPCIGPVFGGFLVEKEGWRWTFWLVASLGGLITITAMVVMSETEERAISFGRMKKLHHLLRSRQSRRWLVRRPYLGSFIYNPLKVLGFSWTMLAPVIYSALMKGYMNVLYTTLTPVFTGVVKYITKWHFTPSQAGFTFDTMLVGTVTGSLAGFIFSKLERNALRKRMQRRHLSLLPYLTLAFIPSSVLASGGLIAFGTTVKKAQTISTLAVTTLATTGTTLGVLTAEAFIYRTARGPIAETMHATNFLGSLAGTLFPLTAQAFYLLPSGIVWVYTIWGVAALFILERVWYWYRNGARITSDLL
ncbi:hypothetical protein JMJ35_009954 [Cladonia borealis]|uniref:Major facilitator superfamily (MFS) profile domain-containing protein n=1 Tax=Cladonia borealis TaxID=184061 RepID=A0AA39U468_9LECA|nr:hypothetical protein JMJ35_009954 [Cladonia borealis]